jgi:predicted enzyme related to lactoylglutathione lyase
MASPHALNWFEIPALDLDRAFAFYSTVLGADHVRKGTFFGNELVLFAVPFTTGEAVGGSIVQRDHFLPSADGALLYINTFGGLEVALERVEEAGGRILAPIMDLGTFGKSAVIIDSEGNRIGLHQTA